MRGLKKLKIELFYDPAIPLLGIYSKDMKSGETAAFPHCSIIHNSLHVETAWVSIQGWIDKDGIKV